MSKKKTEPKNPASDFLELLRMDPSKASLMMAYELGRELGKDMKLITLTLLGIEAHLLAIRRHYEQEDFVYEKETKQTGSKDAIQRPGPFGPGSDSVPDGG